MQTNSLQVRADKERLLVLLALNQCRTEMSDAHGLVLAGMLRDAYKASLETTPRFLWRSGQFEIRCDQPGVVMMALGDAWAEMNSAIALKVWRGLKCAALLVERRRKRESIIADGQLIIEGSRRSRAYDPHPKAIVLSSAVVGIPTLTLLDPILRGNHVHSG